MSVTDLLRPSSHVRRATILVSIGALVTAAVLVAPPVARAAGTLPPTLPSLRQWSAGSGTGFTWTGSGRIVVNTADASSLTADAQVFATDLGLLTNSAAPAVVSGTAGSTGDVFVSLGSSNTTLGTEGYTLTVAPVLRIDARARAGAFWGNRTVLQLIRQATSLPAGTATDYPQFGIRSTLADTASRKRSLGWWFNEVRDLSYLKINELMFYPNLVQLTNAQLQQLDQFAQSRHVNLVPQINMPGHMDFVGLPSQYTLTDKNNNPVPGALDLTNPSAVAWAKNLVTTYIGLFSGPVWHIGADEYPSCCARLDATGQYPKLDNYAHQQYGASGTPQDVYNAFVNSIDDMVTAKGKTSRMWNDDIFASSVVQLHPGITIEDWLRPGAALTPTQLAAAGHQMINDDQDYLYFDEHNTQFPNTTPAKIWENLDPARFNGGAYLPNGINDSHLAGIKFSSYAANFEQEGLIERDLYGLNRALAQRAWGTPKLSSTWAGMASTVAAIGHAPGFLDTPATGDPGASSLPGSPGTQSGTQLNTYTVQPNGSIVHAYYAGASYTSETVAAAGSATGRAIGYSIGSQQHVFARGANGDLRHWFIGSGSGTWTSEDWTTQAATAGSPSLTPAGDPAGFAIGSEADVFARGSNGHLYRWWYAPSDGKIHAADWGGALTNTPAAYAWGDVRSVVARSSSGTLHHWWLQDSEPSSVHQDDWGGSLASDASPAAFGYAEKEQHAYGRDGSGHLQRWVYDHVAGSLTRTDLTTASGKSIAGNPAAVVFGTQQHVYFRDASTGHLDHWFVTPGSAPGFEDLTSSTPGTPVNPAGDPWATVYSGNQLHVWAPDSTGHQHHWFYNGSSHQDTWY